jgi:hypothetical protein
MIEHENAILNIAVSKNAHPNRSAVTAGGIINENTIVNV